MRQSLRLSASPRPVPPYLRVVAASAWEKTSNSRVSCSGVMPMPVSLTLNSIQSWPSITSRATASEIVPRSVNLQALLRRLKRAWRTFVRSARIVPISSGQHISRRFEFFAASGCMTAAMSLTKPATSKLSRYSSILPASILERSSTALISSSRCLPAALIFLRSSVNCSAPRSAASSWSISL